MNRWLEALESLRWGRILNMWALAVGMLCLTLKVCKAPPFSFLFLLICGIRWGCCRRYDHKKEVLCHIKLLMHSSSIVRQCGARWWWCLNVNYFKGVRFSFWNELVFILNLNYVSRIADIAYMLFYEAIKTQCHAHSRIPLACSYSSLIISYTFSLLRNRTFDRLVKSPLAVLDHTQILPK